MWAYRAGEDARQLWPYCSIPPKSIKLFMQRQCQGEVGRDSCLSPQGYTSCGYPSSLFHCLVYQQQATHSSFVMLKRRAQPKLGMYALQKTADNSCPRPRVQMSKLCAYTFIYSLPHWNSIMQGLPHQVNQLCHLSPFCCFRIHLWATHCHALREFRGFIAAQVNVPPSRENMQLAILNPQRPPAFDNGKRHIIRRQGIMAKFVYHHREPVLALWFIAGSCDQSSRLKKSDFISVDRIERFHKRSCRS